MIALTCNLNLDVLGRRIQMLVDHHTLFTPDHQGEPGAAPGPDRRDRRQRPSRSRCPKPQGPVHLDLPEDVALMEASEAVPVIGAPAEPPAPDPGAIAEAAARIAAARRPIAVIGATAMRLAEPGVLRRLIEHHRLPFATTTMAKGLIDEDHPFSIGCIERACRQVQRGFLAKADLIIGIGYDPIEVEYEAWVGSVPVLHVDPEAADTDGSVAIVHEVGGDLASALAGLIAAPPSANDWTEDEVRAHRDRFRAALRPAAPGFVPHQAIDVVRDCLPAEACSPSTSVPILIRSPANGPRTARARS